MFGIFRRDLFASRILMVRDKALKIIFFGHSFELNERFRHRSDAMKFGGFDVGKNCRVKNKTKFASIKIR
jgi:hypothetical protein